MSESLLGSDYGIAIGAKGVLRAVARVRAGVCWRCDFTLALELGTTILQPPSCTRRFP